MNILLIDSKISNYELFNSSANANTTPLVYSSSTSTTEDILSAIRQSISSQSQTIARIGLVFEIKEPRRPTLFLGNAPFFSETDTAEPFSANVAFLIALLTEFQVANIDFLACNSLNVPAWVNYYALLTASTGVIVGASSDNTGNIQYGGDWVMESTSQDIEILYFTSSIENYASLLGGPSGDSFSIVLKSDGNIYGTGRCLAVLDSNTLQQILANTAGKTPKYISTGYHHAVVLMTDGTVYGAGLNDDGQLGLGHSNMFSSSLKPMLMNGKTAKYISTWYTSTLILMTDGTVYGTGYNYSGQLGLGNYTSYNSLQLMTSLTPLLTAGKIVKYISRGDSHSLILMTDGTVYGTGYNYWGQLGLGNYTEKYNTLQPMLMGGKEATYISSGTNHSLILMTDGTVYGTGSSTSGQLGLGNNTDYNTLQLMSSLTPLLTAGKIVKNISAGQNYSLILMTDGTVYGTGLNYYLQLGLGNDTESYNTLQPMLMPVGKLAASISAGSSHALVLMRDDTVYSVGSNYWGQLGTGDNVNYNTLQPMVNGTNVVGPFSLLDIDAVQEPPPAEPASMGPIQHLCFKADTKILTANGYIPVQELRKGDLIKTLRDGYKPIVLLGKQDIKHDAHANAHANNKNVTSEENKNRLYRCSRQNYPDLFEELVITGAHSILVDDLTDLQRENTIKVLSKIYVTDNKYRLPACVDERASIYEKSGNYTIYHLALEHDNYYMNYGIYANGLVVETCSQRYLKEYSGMTFL
jgi:alpha-tubulin suppressor-like RCC1 family protein